jgi:hypothetical protein
MNNPLTEMRVGQRVRLIQATGHLNTPWFPVGTTGVVTATGFSQIPEVYAHVRLDNHFPEMDEWENVLEVGLDGDDCAGEVMVSHFEEIAS